MLRHFHMVYGQSARKDSISYCKIGYRSFTYRKSSINPPGFKIPAAFFFFNYSIIAKSVKNKIENSKSGPNRSCFVTKINQFYYTCDKYNTKKGQKASHQK